jgi:hypothetical protein
MSGSINDIVRVVYEARREHITRPEGKCDNTGRWYPSERENAGGSGSCVRSPSRAWPVSYLRRCRTREHVRELVMRALNGCDVPPDVARAVAVALEKCAA